MLVSRPATPKDLPTPHFPVEAKGLIIEPALVEEAKQAGKRRTQTAKEADDRVRAARKQLADIVDAVRRASGGKIHVHENELKLGQVKIDPNKGLITGGYTVEELLQLWELIPLMLRRHIDSCNRAIAEHEQQRAQADVIFQGARAVKVLIDTPASAEDKAEFVRRAMTDEDVQDALAAADDTGISHAVSDVIRQQVGVPTATTYTDLFMYHLTDAYVKWAKSEVAREGEAMVLWFRVNGVGTWAFLPPGIEVGPIEIGYPEVRRCAEDDEHWRLNADLALEIDKGTFEHVLLHIPTPDIGTALMNQYFNGKLTINGGTADKPEAGVEVNFVRHLGHMFAIAHDGFASDLEEMNMQEDEDDYDDPPF